MNGTTEIASNYKAQIPLTLENGKIISERLLRDGEMVLTLPSFIELAEMAGYQIICGTSEANNG
ncbi:hypothetical protein ACUN3I_14185 [Hafnia alvei]|uniref:hypothetical protein n=1 Tax=Hafnia TaxID=568 RepID=UPI000E027719|nr:MULTISPECIES: hypothetical protein [Hafnia]TBL52708.1 hypothetical protein EYZ00_11605 [Hafnia paralvei]TBL99913.1 hypothetical protein EYY93_12375 [Hafnia paralvei]STQ68372.1 Uncharacterised protein [Hafnia alvei]